MIVNSHYVPLQAPYPIIYGKGEMGMQIGTLIVVEGRDPSQPHRSGNREAPYAIRTHSHPVVSYTNKAQNVLAPLPVPNDASEGIVWDKVEMRDVTVLCYTNNFLSEVAHIRLEDLIETERRKDAIDGKYTFEISKLLNQFRRLGIRSTLSDAFEGIDNGGWVTLTISKALFGDYFFISGSEEAPYLYLAVNNSDDLKDMEKRLCVQIDDYRAAIAPRKLYFKFDSREKGLKQVCDSLNKKYAPY